MQLGAPSIHVSLPLFVTDTLHAVAVSVSRAGKATVKPIINSIDFIFFMVFGLWVITD